MEAIIAAVVTVVIQLLTAGYVYGKLTNEVSNHKSDIQELRLEVNDHETRISRLEGAKEVIH